MTDNITTDNIPYHVPALLPQAIEALDIKPDGIYVDATFGGGGHSRAIVERLGPTGRLYGFDQDRDAMANSIPDERFTFVRSNFMYIPNFMKYYGVEKVDGILADLGVSSHHFDDPERGFSFRADAPLDMRMNTAGGATAADYVNELDESNLTSLLRIGSDLSNCREIARAIIKARATSPILTTGALADTVRPLMNPRNEKKDLAQLFQAFRIRVNNELEVLTAFLRNSTRVLRPGGRLAVITYHSLEDRLVKSFFRTGSFTGDQEKDFFGNPITPWRLITRTPIVPDAEETARNPRSRSAKLRVAELK